MSNIQDAIDDINYNYNFPSLNKLIKLIESKYTFPKDEIIKTIKKYNVCSSYGREWEVNTSINPIDNEYVFDVRTIKGNWRVMKIINRTI